MEEAGRVADRIAVIDHGHIVAEGTAARRSQGAANIAPIVDWFPATLYVPVLAECRALL